MKFVLASFALCCGLGAGERAFSATAAGAANTGRVACGPGEIAILTQAIGAPLDDAALGKMADADGVTTFHAMSEIVRMRGLHAVAFETDGQGLMDLGRPAILRVDLQGRGEAEGDASAQYRFVAFLGAPNVHEVLLAAPMPGSALHGSVSQSEPARHGTGKGLAIRRARAELPPQWRSAWERSFDLRVVVAAGVPPPLVALVAWRSRRWGTMKSVGEADASRSRRLDERFPAPSFRCLRAGLCFRWRRLGRIGALEVTPPLRGESLPVGLLGRVGRCSFTHCGRPSSPHEPVAIASSSAHRS
ncbi:MAG: hypothetical protein ACOC1G_06095 [Phycisphaeraceae bacterium]